jgi:hypothetical protein
MKSWTTLVQGHGIFKVVVKPGLVIPGLGINIESIVHVSAAEIGYTDGAFRPIIGAASIQVLNVAPQANGNVDVLLNVLWEKDLEVRLSYTLADPGPVVEPLEPMKH